MMLHAINPFKMTGKVQVVVIYCENSPLYFFNFNKIIQKIFILRLNNFYYNFLFHCNYCAILYCSKLYCVVLVF